MKGPDEIEVAWKSYTGKVIQEKHVEQWKRGVEEKSKLKAYRAVDKPVKTKCWDGSKGSRLLFQGRAGMINLEKRKQKWTNGSDRKCRVCREDVDETIDHMMTWCTGYRALRDQLFVQWRTRDGQCKSLEQVRDMAENDRLAWILGLKGDFPGSRVGLESEKGFLVQCWESRNNILGLITEENRGQT